MMLRRAITPILIDTSCSPPALRHGYADAASLRYYYFASYADITMFAYATLLGERRATDV